MEQAGYDVLVVGGGAAGLSAALTLARARRSVLVVDDGRPRNAAAGHVHGYLTRDGMPPAELLAMGRAEVTRYGAEVVGGRVVAARRLPAGGFEVTLADGSSAAARRLLIATGLVDELPQVPGVPERWGREVVHCPYCHGWELRDRAVGVLGGDPSAVSHALLWRQWSADVTLFLHTGAEPDDAECDRLAARGVTVVAGEVTGLRVDDDRLTGVRVAGGRVVRCEAFVVDPRSTARADDLVRALGLDPTQLETAGQVTGSYLATDPEGATAVPGLWVAGNAAGAIDQVLSAAATGVRAGSAINLDLLDEDVRLAVEARAGQLANAPR